MGNIKSSPENRNTIIFNSIYSAITGSSEKIYGLPKENEILEDIAESITGTGLFVFACIGRFDKNMEFKYHAACGPGKTDLDLKNSVAAAAWKNRKIHFTNNFLKGKKFGLNSMAAFPILINNRIYAILALAGTNPHFNFDRPLIESLENAVKLIEISIYNLNLKKEKLKLEKYKKNALEKIKYITFHDPLTSLTNIEMFGQNIKTMQPRAGRTDRIVYILILDIDDMKDLNEKYGRSVGDEVLVLVAKRLASFSEYYNHIIPYTPSRLGGDEFGLAILSRKDTANSSIELICKELRRELSRPVYFKGEIIDIRLSIGASVCPGCESGTCLEPETLIRMAYQALYKSKSMGKNTISFFDKNEEINIVSYYQKVHEIENSLKTNKFTLYYQPKVNLESGKIEGLEALIRGIGKDGKIIPPSEFIPIAEESDIIVDIGDYVLKNVLKQISEWLKIGIKLPVSINVSARQLRKQDFLKKITDALSSYPDVPPGLIQMEITETAILEDIEYVKEIIKQCSQDIGISFAIDDFGAGYASLVYFKELPLDHVKIDMAFIRKMLEDKSDMLMVQTLISISKILKRKITAEGVETLGQCIILNMLGCDNIQGYYTGRPVPSVKIPEQVANFKLPGKFISWKDVKLSIGDFGDFPVILAYVEHNEWIERIKSLCKKEKEILSREEKQKIGNFRVCEFGSWYYNEGQKYKNIEYYKKLEELHVKAHELADKTMKLCASGNSEKARPLLETMESNKEKIQVALLNLAKEISIKKK